MVTSLLALELLVLLGSAQQDHARPWSMAPSLSRSTARQLVALPQGSMTFNVIVRPNNSSVAMKLWRFLQSRVVPLVHQYARPFVQLQIGPPHLQALHRHFTTESRARRALQFVIPSAIFSLCSPKAKIRIKKKQFGRLPQNAQIPPVL